MRTYPGLPEPTVDVVIAYQASRERYQEKAAFCLPLERLADLPTTTIDATAVGRAIGSDLFENLDLVDRAVLFRTDFSSNWGTDAP